MSYFIIFHLGKFQNQEHLYKKMGENQIRTSPFGKKIDRTSRFRLSALRTTTLGNKPNWLILQYFLFNPSVRASQINLVLRLWVSGNYKIKLLFFKFKWYQAYHCQLNIMATSRVTVVNLNSICRKVFTQLTYEKMKKVRISTAGPLTLRLKKF